MFSFIGHPKSTLLSHRKLPGDPNKLRGLSDFEAFFIYKNLIVGHLVGGQGNLL
jgi:hypothetical protein